MARTVSKFILEMCDVIEATSPESVSADILCFGAFNIYRNGTAFVCEVGEATDSWIDRRAIRRAFRRKMATIIPAALYLWNKERTAK